jgi:hypothetical protein
LVLCPLFSHDPRGTAVGVSLEKTLRDLPIGTIKPNNSISLFGKGGIGIQELRII